MVEYSLTYIIEMCTFDTPLEALLNDTCRTATVKTAKPSTVLVLSKEG